MTTLIRLSTSQIDSFDLVSGRVRQLRDRLFVNNCVAVLWTEAEIVVTGFDPPSDQTVVVTLEDLKLRKTGRLVQGRKFHSAVKYRELIYVMGGYSAQFLKLRSCESFDGRKWTPEADLVETRSGHSAVTCSDAIYVLGDNTSRSIERFDGVSWHLLPFSLMYDTTNLALVPLRDGTLMVIGGGSAATGATDIVRVQDLRSELSTRVDKLPAD
jgi:hypothetical protein